MLGVSTSGYYGWLKRCSDPPAGRAAHNDALLAQIRQIHAEFAYYGSPRVHRELRSRDMSAGRHTVARLMRRHGIAAHRGKPKSRPRAAPPARRPEIVDLVKRKFRANAPNRIWFTDITMIRTGEGWLYAAVILDAFNREIVSWAVETYDSPGTALRALREAIASRHPQPGCIVHSDRGYQGGLNWWSQHLDLRVASCRTDRSRSKPVCIEVGSRLRGARRSLGVRIASSSGGDRAWCKDRRRMRRGARVGAGRLSLVSSRWRRGSVSSAGGVGSLLVFRGT